MRTLIFYTLFLGLLFSCSNSSGGEAEASSTNHAGHDHAGHNHAGHNHDDHKHAVPSRTPAERAEFYVRAVDLAKNAIDQQKTFQDNGKQYELSYKTLEGTVVKATIKSPQNNGELEENYYLKAAGPVVVRHFQTDFSKEGDPMVDLTETFYYFDNLRVVEAKQRTKTTAADGNLKFNEEPFEMLETDLDAITSVLYKNLTSYKTHIE